MMSSKEQSKYVSISSFACLRQLRFEDGDTITKLSHLFAKLVLGGSRFPLPLHIGASSTLVPPEAGLGILESSN